MTQLLIEAMFSPDALMRRALILPIAVALDMLFGDPHSAYHPVAWLGALIQRAERLIRRVCGRAEGFGGLLLVAITVSVAVGPILTLTLVLASSFPVLVWPLEAALVWLALASRALAHEGREVSSLLRRQDLGSARARVSRLVARRTDDLTEREVSRAAVESLGENVVDAVIAPLFWAATLGGAGAWLHKAGSTLDSMVGYRNERYRRFGTAAARLDDVLAWLPARLALLVVPAAAVAAGFSWRHSWNVGRRDRRKHASPNSAHGEAAFSGALEVRLGGRAEYDGLVCSRQTIGAEFQSPGATDPGRAAALVTRTTVVTTIVLAAVLLVISAVLR